MAWNLIKVEEPELDAVSQEYLDELTEDIGHLIFPITNVVTVLPNSEIEYRNIFKLSEKEDIYFRDDKISYLILEASTKDLGNITTVDDIEFYDDEQNIVYKDIVGKFVYNFDKDNRKLQVLIPVIWTQPTREAAAQTGSRNVKAILYVSLNNNVEE